MSATTIRYRNSEFVDNDLPIEVWLLAVVREIAADAEIAPWLDDLSEEWRLQAISGFGFGPSPALDKFLNTGDRREQMAHYFRKALESLSQRSTVITVDELSQSGVGGQHAIYTQELSTRLVIDVGNKFLDLIS